MCDSEHIYFTFLTLASPSGKWGFVPSSMGSFKDYLKDYLWSCNYNSSLQGIDCLVREISSRRGKWALALGTWQRIDLRWEGQKPRWVLKDSPGLLGAENGIRQGPRYVTTMMGSWKQCEREDAKETRKQLHLGIRLKPYGGDIEAWRSAPSNGVAIEGLGGRDFSEQSCDLEGSPW